MSRERVFECTFSTDPTQRVGHVVAWAAGEAADLFADRLEVERIVERGVIAVRDAAGRVAGRASFPRHRSRVTRSETAS